jgi:hypothetical protein
MAQSMNVRRFSSLQPGAFLRLFVLLALGLPCQAGAQSAGDASLERAEAQYRQARRALAVAQTQQRLSRRRRHSLLVHAGLGFRFGDWKIHERVDGFVSGGPEFGLSYRRYWNDRAGFTTSAGFEAVRMAIVESDGPGYEFGRRDIYGEAAVHFSPSVGGRFYLGPTVRAGYWRLQRDKLSFYDSDSAWGRYDDVPVDDAWALLGGPHVGWQFGRRNDLDLSLHTLVGAWHEGSRWALLGGTAVRLGYMFSLGRAPGG